MVKCRYTFRGLRIICFVIWATLLVQPLCGQIAEREFEKVIAAVEWTPDERQAIRNGETVVRSLETSEKQELATIGILRIKDFPAVSLVTFRESLSQKGSGAMKAGGQFSDPPTVEDLRTLVLDDNSIEQLQKCGVGDCDLNLSAEMITRFQREVDWDSPNAAANAARLFREMMVGYVGDYWLHGDSSLGTYDNRRKSVDLIASHRSLLSNSLFIDELAPKFANYLARFPADKLENGESSMHWSVVDFGLKPSITVSHSSVFAAMVGNTEQLFVASKQIYASRYLDSSLSFTMLLRVSAGDSVDTYLIFADRSRSDVLDGALGGFARGMVRKESIARTKALLDKIHLRLLAAVRPPAEPSDKEDSLMERALTSARRRPWLTAVLLLLGLVALFLFSRRKRMPE